MPSLDEIRKKKLEELMRVQQDKAQQQAEEQAQIQQQIEAMENAVKQFFTKEALTRYGNLRTAHPEKAVQLLLILFNAIRTGQLKNKITDQELKSILERFTPKKKEIKIKRV